jgi:photosystem II stability/assembly factor-like uncharacterized protein
MKLNASVSIALAAVLSLALSLTARADSGDHRAREAGPEDGILCCSFVLEDRFLFHGDRVLVTTGRAGIFRSEHRGAGWQRSMKGLVGPNGASPFPDSLCQARSEPRVVYALTGLGGDVEPSVFDGLFSSDDFGKTWTRRASVITVGQASCDVDPEDPRTLYVSGFNPDFVFEVWKSTDGGRTVRQVVVPPVSFGFVRVVRGTVYFVDFDQGRLYASTDGGASFHPRPTPPGFVGNFDASPDGRLIFVTSLDEAFRPIGTFRSSDGGASYVAVSGLPDGFSFLVFHPTDPSRVYTTDGLLRVSADGGLSFALVPASNDPRFIGAVPVNSIGVDAHGSVYLNTMGGPFRTDDGGQTFRSLLNGFRASAVQDLAFDADGNLLVGVLHTQVVFRQTHGRTFRPIGNTPLIDLNRHVHDAAVVAGSPTDANVILVAITAQGLFRTDNGGRSWTLAEMPDSLAVFFNARMAFATASRVYLVSSYFVGPGLYRSDDAGRTFALLSSVPFGAIAVDPTNPEVLYVGDHRGDAGLFKSTDGGQTLQDLGQPGTFSALAVDRRNTEVIYAGERFGQVIRSRDGGRTFEPASTGLAGAGVHGLAQDAHGTLYVWLRGGGVFSSDDGASNWKPVDTGEALRRSGVEVGRGTLVADPRRPGRVYLGNAGVIQIDAGGNEDHND